MHFSPNEHMRGQHIDCENGSATLAEDGSAVIIRREGCSEGSRVVTCVKSDMTFTVHDGEKGGSFAEGYTPKSEVWIMLGFSNDGEEAVNLASLDPAAELSRAKEFYRKKFENLYVKTPDENLNEAFTHAYLNLEYAWLYPLGWIESIQHWPTMWHMEQTAAEEWCGNAERTRRTLLTQMEYLFDSGAVPDMCVNHVGRRDWGGNNHFFFREVLHYLRMTNDRDFALTVEPVMEKILSQTLREYDATGTGVLSWHSQIGNQEDMESTPGRGAATGSEGAQMLKLLSELYGYLGNEEKSARYPDINYALTIIDSEYLYEGAKDDYLKTKTKDFYLENKDKLKEANDWNQPLDKSKCVSYPITDYKNLGKKTYSLSLVECNKILNEYSEKLSLPNPSKTPHRYNRVLQVDAEGKILHQIYGVHQHYDNPNWKKTDEYTSYSITLWVITDKDGNYDKENGVLVMYSNANDSDKSFIYEPEDILEFKNKNDWANVYCNE